jgi:WD40 repeat protein
MTPNSIQTEPTDAQSKVHLEFTDIGMNTRTDANENFVYACTRHGQIFVFNMAKMEIEHVRVIEPMIKKTGILTTNSITPSLRLNTLSVSDSYCATGSDDGFVRIWPLDFAQVTVEAEHEAPIGLVRFSSDCLRICSATLTGNLGILDVKQKEYITLVRSHTDSIADLAFDPSQKFLATSSLDYSVRVWSYDNCRQLYDFSAPNERPTRLCFHPDKLGEPVFACGFSSGRIRVFSVLEAKLLFELDSPHSKSAHPPEITDLRYSNEGKRLISGDAAKYVCLYDSERDYQLLRLLPSTIFALGSLSVSPEQKNLALIGPADHLISVFESSSLNEILRIDISAGGESSRLGGCVSAVRLEYASCDLNQLLCVTSSNKLLKFDSRTGRLLSSIPRIHRSLTDCLSVSSDGRFLGNYNVVC